MELPIALAVLAGLEPADFRSLDWSEVDIDGGVIRRGRSKTGYGIVVTIGSTLREVLVRHRAPSGPVIRHLPRSESSTHKALSRMYERAGLPKASRSQGGWLRLRHTFATHLDQEGAGVRTIGQALGHKPGSHVTLRYIHSDEERMRRSVEAMDRRISAAAK